MPHASPLNLLETSLVLRIAISSLAVVLLLAVPSGAGAQVTPVEGPLPREVEARILELANEEGALRFPGGSRVPAGTLLEGDVVVLGGSLRLGGRIRGTLAVVNGDLSVEPGARVDGPVWVLGGTIQGEVAGAFAEEPRVYQAPLRYRIRADRVEGLATGADLASRFLDADLGFGRTRFTLRAAGAYNRSEGLPVQFGPIVETRGRNPLVLEAFGIWRSAGGLAFETEDLGYHVTLDQSLGGRGTLSLGAEAYSKVRSVEARGFTDQESALATFFLNRDLRDHLEVRGWGAYLELRPVRTPVRIRVGFREEDQGFAPVRSPWTLGRGDDPWRPQPRVAEGTARFLDGRLEWDSRDDPFQPSDGFHLLLRGTHQVGGTLRSLPEAATDPEDRFDHGRVTWGSADLRRYARVSPSSRLAVRLYTAGSLRDEPLPAQFQSTLGGEGSLPGHPAFSVACDARSLLVPPPGDAPPGQQALGAYGCDQVGLAQIELQRTLPLVWDPSPEDWEGSEWASLLRIQPVVSVFLNAGEGRSANQEGFLVRTDSPGRADVGVGLVTGSLGLYWAYPLNRKDRGINFFIRLDRRF
jgi:hypothetical protein